MVTGLAVAKWPVDHGTMAPWPGPPGPWDSLGAPCCRVEAERSEVQPQLSGYD